MMSEQDNQPIPPPDGASGSAPIPPPDGADGSAPIPPPDGASGSAPIPPPDGADGSAPIPPPDATPIPPPDADPLPPPTDGDASEREGSEVPGAPSMPTRSDAASAPTSQPDVVVRRHQRRRPRFQAPPKKEEDVVVNRMDLFNSQKNRTGAPAFSRQRKIAGNLPDWEPTPPGEVLIDRSKASGSAS